MLITKSHTLDLDVCNKKECSQVNENFTNREKSKKTCLEKYGVDNPTKVQEINKKIINTKIKRRLDSLIECGISGLTDESIDVSTRSGKEILLSKFIENNYDSTIEYNNKNIVGKELDIFLPDLKLAFEFNGLFWHNETSVSDNYHYNKTELCEKNGIKLIHIFEDDWEYKQDIIKSRILNLLGKSNKIFARKCEVKEIEDNKLVREFLEKNHLQGFIGSKIKIGLFYQGELVSLMTFGSYRKAMGQKSIINSYEMLRFCNKLNTSVIGGASKLFKYFIDNFQPNEIISYADRNWSNGNLYENLGFNLVHKTKPNYYYIIDKKRKHRFGFRKDVLIKNGADPNKTEHQIMLEKGIYRIFDSGNLKYIFKK